MKKHSLFISLAILIFIALLFSFIPIRPVAADEYSPCPPGTGPGGITAGDYDPTTLTQDQRQWLFTIFGNAGIAPIGYGGQRCGQTPPTTAPHPAWFGQGCGTSYTGPGGLRAGGYDPTSLTQDQRQWLFEVFGNEGLASVGYGGSTCDWQNVPPPPPPPPSHPAWFGQGCGTSYTGPGGLRAGGYAPTSLTQDQRQWLFEVFGNEGLASVGYGGSTCSWQNVPPPAPSHPAWFGQGCGTSYTGPGGLRAGGYAPTSLTQDQRQWLFEVFGNEGLASVGYGGSTCSWQSGPITCPSSTGPGGITAGSYDPTKLTQDQRQWLFNLFGNNGIAPVGYGGQTCSGGSTTIPCPAGTGPDSITAGSYDPTKLSQSQRDWLYNIFGHTGSASVGYGGETCIGGIPYTPGSGTSTKTCPAGTGPDGITAGSYDPTKLSQTQRDWLYNIFGHIGSASVGYGGETCSGGISYTPGTSFSTRTCPTGTGPGGITAGSYDPIKLNQDQRNWLFNIFGHAGNASAGYGGETCSGGTSYMSSGSINGSNTGGTNSGDISSGETLSDGNVLGDSTQSPTNSGGQSSSTENNPSTLDWFWATVDVAGKVMNIANNNLSNTFEAVSVIKDSYDLMSTSMTLEQAQQAYLTCKPWGSPSCLELRRAYSQAELAQLIVPLPFADIILKATGWWNPLIDAYEQAKYGN